MPTIEDLGDLNEGVILIVGPRRSGKTYLTERLLARWEASGEAYKHFSLERPRNWTRTPRTHMRTYGGGTHRENVMTKCRGIRRVILDQPDSNLMPNDVPVRLLVLVSDEPPAWMRDAADCVVWAAHSDIQGYVYSVTQGPSAPLPPPRPSPTVWERLLAAV